jgi:tetratricopeptide (TPR) repeat protein
VNYLAYKNALKQAWKDGRMSADESAILDTLRKSLNISAEEHMHIEREVRSELAGTIPENINPGPGGVELESTNGAGMVEDPPGSNGNGNVPAGGELSTEELLQSNNIKELLTAGKNSYHKGNYEEAIEFCDKVLLLDPDNSEALFFRKRTLSKIEKMRGKKGGAGGTKKAPEQAPAPPKEEQATEGEVADIEASLNEAADMNIDAINDSPEVTPAPNTDNNSAPEANGETKAADPNCKSCGGSGQCHWCQGSGKCYWCKGSGDCDKCKGEGQINGEDCKSCKGTGKCHSCNGDTNCYWCKGTGKCSKCSL